MKGTISELQEIREVFGLTKSEMADLLGRRAQSIVEWETRGVPRDKRASVERLLDLAQLFRRRVIATRIPEIVRTPDSWLGNRTILETLRIDGVDPIYAYLGRLFNYGAYDERPACCASRRPLLSCCRTRGLTQPTRRTRSNAAAGGTPPASLALST
jgi:DNA-binding XRE family transcriptional regulator